MCVHLFFCSSEPYRSCLAFGYRWVFERICKIHKETTSDNGTNFVGAVNELTELVNRLDKDKIQIVGGQGNIKWKFNPPAAPHFGGCLKP